MTPLLPLVAACAPTAVSVDNPPPVDSDTGDEAVILPFDTEPFIPVDTAPDVLPDLEPDHWIHLRQDGQWILSGNPYSDLTGQLRIREFIDEIDTNDTAVLDPYVCEVTYSLTGSAVGSHTCPSCDFVFEVEHFVIDGDPGNCQEPDAPADGALWQLGYDSAASSILHNYFGTDVWLPWYDTLTGAPNIQFEWDFTLAVELEDTSDMN